MKAQTLGDTSSLEFMRGRRILEINPDHPIIKDLNVSFAGANLLSGIKFVHGTKADDFICRLHARMIQRAQRLRELLISCMIQL